MNLSSICHACYGPEHLPRRSSCDGSSLSCISACRAAAVEVEKNVTVPVSTDKGLCGGINSTVSKYARGTLKAFEEGEQHGWDSRFLPSQTAETMMALSRPTGSHLMHACLHTCKRDSFRCGKLLQRARRVSWW